MYRDAAGLLTVERLEAVETPALLLHGAQTTATIPAFSTGFARRLRQSTTVEIEVALHTAALSYPAACAEAIRSFPAGA